MDRTICDFLSDLKQNQSFAFTFKEKGAVYMIVTGPQDRACL